MCRKKKKAAGRRKFLKKTSTFAARNLEPVYQFFKTLLFRLSPEKAHRWTVALLDFVVALPFGKDILRSIFPVKNPPQPIELMGLKFTNRVGLAAGFDKDARHIEGMAALGFGHVEVGTVTPRPQDGNPQPRLFRLPADAALINRMGFNNGGVDEMARRLEILKKKGRPKNLVIGGNIGKNKTTPNESATDDYLFCFEKLHRWVDYFVVNVSSPNTPNLRELQEKEPLTRLLNLLQEKNQALENPKPILLKIAPDLNDSQLADIADIVKTTRLAGIVATNTTISRENLKTAQTEIEKIGMGGLSGQPVKKMSTEVIRKMRNLLGGQFVIIGVGGIGSAADAKEKVDAGADLVQIYTGLIYVGGGLPKKIVEKLDKV